MSIINAIINLVNDPIIKIQDHYNHQNRANNMGKALEEYIKDLFGNTLTESNIEKRIETHSNVFSYLGNQNNPPDLILRNGDAIEVKKITTSGAILALNSSYPKAKLFSSSPMILDACRKCENWDVKDIIYTVGVAKENKLKTLVFVYGEDFAASAEVYERVKYKIKEGVNSIPNVEFAVTSELGRINQIDPLGYTSLRVRGMWQITNPIKAFDYIYKQPSNSIFSFMAIINQSKYSTFKDSDIEIIEGLANKIDSFNIVDKKIKEPDNPAKLRDVKLITFDIF